MISARHYLQICLLMGAALIAGGCASRSATPLARTEQLDLTATVESIDHRSRIVVLRDDAGNRIKLEASNGVRNLGQVNIGDRVDVGYRVGLALEVTRPEATPSGTAREIAITRAAPGSLPAGEIGQTFTTNVQIQSVDTSFHTVTFRGDDGIERIVGVNDPAAQQFIRQLKRGDRVQVTYTEAIAVSVRRTN